MKNILLPAHPLARYGKAFDDAYSNMNGFGNALRAFGLQMSYNLGLCGIFLSLARLRKGVGNNGPEPKPDTALSCLSHKAGQYVPQLDASARKFKEDGKGGQQEQSFGEPLSILKTEAGKRCCYSRRTTKSWGAMLLPGSRKRSCWIRRAFFSIFRERTRNAGCNYCLNVLQRGCFQRKNFCPIEHSRSTTKILSQACLHFDSTQCDRLEVF